MNLGQFSVSLTVKNIEIARDFYQKLGFEAVPDCGSVKDKWLIMKNQEVVIGLFEGMFDHNILTFNPKDVRSIERELVTEGVEMDTPSKGDSGPAHIIFKDPDGNVIMLDQW